MYFCFTAVQGGLTPGCNPLKTPVTYAFHVNINKLLQYQGNLDFQKSRSAASRPRVRLVASLQGNSTLGAASFKSGKLQAGNQSEKK